MNQRGEHRVRILLEIRRAVQQRVALPLLPQVRAFHNRAAFRIGIGVDHRVHGDAAHIQRSGRFAGIPHHGIAHGFPKSRPGLRKERRFIHLAVRDPVQAEIRLFLPRYAH